ncbi:MAG: DUF4338 domain-containing protein [Gammaproteobacteria bacterium]|nr:DUF4338 domain-containing protein [Gammaproteobacteria bacterium]
MHTDIVYRRRCITSKDLSFIRNYIDRFADKGRSYISREICKSWNWRQHNGALKDMVCRGLLLRLEEQGYIKLPARKRTPNVPYRNRKKPKDASIEQSPVDGKLSNILPIEIKQVRRTGWEETFNGLIEQYHYLRYTQPVGEHLKFIAFANGRPIACLAWSSAPRHIKSRDEFIGWSPDTRKKNLHLISYNTRFLILPWVRVKHLASYLLGLSARTISEYWQGIYNHPLYYLETFVDTERFKGTCYRAANWQYLGNTTGRGKDDRTNRINRSIKAVYGYPLSRDFRKVLCHG